MDGANKQETLRSKVYLRGVCLPHKLNTTLVCHILIPTETRGILRIGWREFGMLNP